MIMTASIDRNKKASGVPGLRPKPFQLQLTRKENAISVSPDHIKDVKVKVGR